MSEQAGKKSTVRKDDVVELAQGPFREYQPVDTYWSNEVGKVKLLDAILSLTIAVSFGLFMIKSQPGGFTRDISEREQEIVDALEYFQLGKFDLNILPSLGIQLLSLFPLQIEVLRKISVGVASLTLSFLFLTLRRVNTSFPFAISGAIALGSLPIFQIEAASVSIYVIQWFFLSMASYLWQSAKCSRHFTKAWFSNLLLLAVTLGLGASTRYIGLLTWVWVSIVSMKEFWNVLGDTTLTSRYLTKYVAVKVIILGIIPFAVFMSSLSLQMLSWTHDTPELSQYMSPNFKAYLRGPFEHPEYLYYGSVITLRHHESLGGYLHSHNHTYPSGSGEQQVSLTQQEEDYNNKWCIEPPRPHSDENGSLRKVNDFGKVRLRHCATGKLLRASSAKPPVSEQEYNSEISCTGDADYVGNSDELWTVVSVGDPLHSALRPLKSLVKFLNEGQGCTMLAHDTRLPNWGFHQQEVLCLRSPTESRTLFEIETEQLNATDKIEYRTFTGDARKVIGFVKLLVELVQRQYKWNYYENKFKKHSEPTVEKWPFQLFQQKYVTHIWISSVLYPLCFVIYQAVQMLPWRRPAIRKASKTLNTIIHVDFAVECLLGWFLHYRPFVASPHADQKMSSYVSSLFFGQLLVWKAVDSWCKTRLLYGALICIYIAYILHG
ncbi:hypothetical protein HG536_0E03110 [Torulaspora globosa]|uniref:dolichyl-phosphate-mannose--protein mannosyltransferase n=1 Tax=Torulaspora globosa TaxID=48254 RepID=A0A7G3ZIR4_9SACH|nr:uncharacterized protein HG536_0E03110 [Torulaspora globosa]QLL33400.1 hypothetical protein HG536_0E03110 [Torulaspora globosa]